MDPRLGVLPNFISHRSLWRLGRTKVRKRCTWPGSRELGGEVGYNPWTSPFLGGFAIRVLTSHHLPAQPSASKCHSPPAAVNLALCVVHPCSLFASRASPCTVAERRWPAPMAKGHTASGLLGQTLPRLLPERKTTRKSQQYRGREREGKRDTKPHKEA